MKRMILLIVVAWHEIHVFILEISFFLLIKKNKKNTVSLSLSLTITGQQRLIERQPLQISKSAPLGTRVRHINFSLNIS